LAIIEETETLSIERSGWPSSFKREDDLTGILHLLDYLQDCAVDEHGLPEEDVLYHEPEEKE